MFGWRGSEAPATMVTSSHARTKNRLMRLDSIRSAAIEESSSGSGGNQMCGSEGGQFFVLLRRAVFRARFGRRLDHSTYASFDCDGNGRGGTFGGGGGFG